MYSCVGNLAASIKMDCNSPLESGYTGRAIIMTADAFAQAAITRNAQNPRIITSFGDGSKPAAFIVDNITMTPFDGSSTTGNGGRLPKISLSLLLSVALS